MKQMILSMVRLPLWVHVWIWVLLLPINIASLFFMDTATGLYGAIAIIFVLMVNSALILINQGMSKVLAIPHLIAWGPLVIYIVWRALFGAGYIYWDNEALLALGLLIVNIISLGFDVYDTREWRAGNRSIIGFPEAKPRI